MERFYQGYRGGYYLRNTPFLCGSILKLRKLWKIIAGDQLTSKVGEGRRHIKAWEFMGHGCYRTEVGTLQKRTRKESKIYLMITFHIIFWYLKNRHDLEMEIKGKPFFTKNVAFFCSPVCLLPNKYNLFCIFVDLSSINNFKLTFPPYLRFLCCISCKIWLFKPQSVFVFVFVLCCICVF